MANTVKVSHETLGEREMTKAQFALIGQDPKTNGGWSVSTPPELGDTLNSEGGVSEEAAILQTAQERYKQLTGKTAGRKPLAELNQLIAQAEADAANKLPNA